MIDKRSMMRVNDLGISNVEGKEELAELAVEASQFLQWHKWCKLVQQGYLDRGWPGILAVFYFEIETNTRAADSELWVIVGDLPPAYMDVVHCPDGATALEDYVYAMQEWVAHVDAKQTLTDVIPVYRRHSFVRVKPNSKYAEVLRTRLDFIRAEILPNY